MRFASGISQNDNIQDALEEVIGQIDLDSVSFLMTFFTEPFIRDTALISQTLRTALRPDVFIGVSGESIIGPSLEIEQVAGISVLAAQLPDVIAEPFAIQPEQLQQALEDIRRILPPIDDPALIITLADPFTTPISELLSAFNRNFPNIPLTGGMASAARQSGDNVLLINDRLMSGGAVGVILSGNLKVDTIVSQGCRPVGIPFQIDEAQNNVIYSMNGAPPVAHLQRLIASFPDDERDLLENGIFIGRAVNTDTESIGRGDFLVRGVVGVDNRYGVMAIGDYIKAGETVQFHVRDAITATEDLSMLLATQAFYEPPSGALLFTCNGRGTRLFTRPNADVSTIEESLGEVPIAGFFAAGEIGPIGGTNFLHGHTASLVLFRPGD